MANIYVIESPLAAVYDVHHYKTMHTIHVSEMTNDAIISLTCDLSVIAI